jgi:hypothetical protein
MTFPPINITHFDNTHPSITISYLLLFPSTSLYFHVLFSSLDFIYERKNVIVPIKGLAYFICHYKLQLHPFSFKLHNCIHLYEWIKCHCVWIHIFFIHLPIDKYLEWFYNLATVNSAVINMSVHLLGAILLMKGDPQVQISWSYNRKFHLSIYGGNVIPNQPQQYSSLLRDLIWRVSPTLFEVYHPPGQHILLIYLSNISGNSTPSN